MFCLQFYQLFLLILASWLLIRSIKQPIHVHMWRQAWWHIPVIQDPGRRMWVQGQPELDSKTLSQNKQTNRKAYVCYINKTWWKQLVNKYSCIISENLGSIGKKIQKFLKNTLIMTCQLKINFKERTHWMAENACKPSSDKELVFKIYRNTNNSITRK
jgi:hypothetical protein